MQSLRARLFLSVGAIFLLIAILSYTIPKIFVRKDVDIAASKMNTIFKGYQQKIEKATESWVTYRFLQAAAELNAVMQSIPSDAKNNWELAARVVAYSPELAFVQVTGGSQTVIISPENGTVYIPEWAKDSQDRLWIKIRSAIFATADQGDGIFLLLAEGEGKEVAHLLTYTPFEQEPRAISLQDAPTQMYQALKWQENVQLQKARLIGALASKRDEAAGIMKMDGNRGGALLARDIFFTKPFVDPKQKPELFVLVRELALSRNPGPLGPSEASRAISFQNPYKAKNPDALQRWVLQAGPYVDLVQLLSQGEKSIAVGFSISTICRQVAQTLQRPILLYQGQTLLQAFTSEGTNLPTRELTFTAGDVEWNDERYTPTHIEIADLKVSVLTPKSFLGSIVQLLNKLHDSLVTKISLNLFAIALVLLMLALLLLARISKKITEPIALLAAASEEIGNGKYEGLNLPATEKRQDEVAVLTHSFQKMVVSLLEREKIRGVLNKVVSKEIASKVLSGTVELGGEERVLTMLFSDIRGFTHMSEKLDPRTLIVLLNTYMTRMCRIVDATHGVVDKFVGDEIMALYGAPLDLENHGDKGVEAALLMIADLKAWNSERTDGGPPITVGIGIHTGVAFSGNMGAENRLNYTVVGSNVNLAARLCSAAKPMQVLVSEATYLSLSDRQKYHFEKLSPLTLKGIDEPVLVYSVRSIDDHAIDAP